MTLATLIEGQATVDVLILGLMNGGIDDAAEYQSDGCAIGD